MNILEDKNIDEEYLDKKVRGNIELVWEKFMYQDMDISKCHEKIYGADKITYPSPKMYPKMKDINKYGVTVFYHTILKNPTVKEVLKAMNELGRNYHEHGFFEELKIVPVKDEYKKERKNIIYISWTR